MQSLLESRSKFERHNTIENRIDGRAQVVRNAGDVREQIVEIHLRIGRFGANENGEHALNVKRSPAEKEAYDHGD